ncbi:MAG: GDSL-type esterase/lipase family protein, partial [Pseudomonadota bacterium]
MGVVGAFVFVEVALQVTGRAYVRSQHTQLFEEYDDTVVYRIVALGESTTAQMGGPAWPEFLEQALNTHAGYPKFQVINAGVPGASSKDIADSLAMYIRQYKPSIVITMIGVNDLAYQPVDALRRSWIDRVSLYVKTLRVYRFVSILWQQITGRNDRDFSRALGCTYDDFGGKLMDDLHAQNLTQDEHELKSFIAAFPFSYRGYALLIDYFARNNQWDDAVFWVHRAIEQEPYIQLCISRFIGSSVESENGVYDDATSTFRYIHEMKRVVMYGQRYKKQCTSEEY